MNKAYLVFVSVVAVVMSGLFAYHTGSEQTTGAYADTLNLAKQTIQNLSHQVDSLATIADTATMMKKKLREQRIVIREIHASCVRYAKSVEKNPSLSIFIVQWIDRRFRVSFPDD